jgi:hypothetical protein
VSTPLLPGSAVRMTPATSPSPVKRTRSGAAHGGDNLGMPRLVCYYQRRASEG